MREEFLKFYCVYLGWDYLGYEYTISRLCESGHFHKTYNHPIMMTAFGWIWAKSGCDKTARHEMELLEADFLKLNAMYLHTMQNWVG